MDMTLPGATYRLQLREGMDFDKARDAVPYLARLGITHLYLSPIFTAEPGSTHGYDVTDCNEIDPTLGGRAGFEALCADLRAHGLGLILDIVPNHMAASLSNRWWADVLRNGRTSAFARHFDIDWSEPLTLPVLGKPFTEANASGELRLERDAHAGWQLAYVDQLFPLAPESFDIAASGDLTDRELIAQVHQRQHWRLTFWKEARNHLSYRRFFEVTGLVGMRVEDPAVFEATHALIFDLVDKGFADGLRVDHVDGLSLPTDYLNRLRQRIGPDIYLIVEKITEGDEQLPGEWPVEGTTGYEFISAMATALVDADGVARLGEALANLTGGPFDLEHETRAAKEQMVSVNFAGEVDRLAVLAAGQIDLDKDALREAIREVLIAFPVYRTYADSIGVRPADAALLEEVRRAAARHADANAVDSIVALISLGRGSEFQTRFQQLSGPIMAKTVEDTLFYRDHRLLGLNEVGGNPLDGARASPDRAHERLAALVRSHPSGLRATATHDTKRGEDARARLYALSEIPDAFAEGVRRWSEMTSGDLESETRWMIFQALIGIWPTAAPDAAQLATLRNRFLPYLEKASREAKQQTSWTEPDEAYEREVKDFGTRLLAPTNGAFHADFGKLVQRLHLPGWMNSLSQTTLKLTLPGVPDIYQGTEFFDDSLVDPDNRRPLSFDTLARSVSDNPLSWENWLEADAKQRLIHILLGKKGAGSEVSRPTYSPLPAVGPAADHCFAFKTQWDRQHAVIVVPRLTARLFDTSDRIVPPAWADTILETGVAAQMRNIIVGSGHTGPSVSLGEIFAMGPVAVLLSE